MCIADPEDYNSESLTATFEEGESRTSVCIPIVNDSFFEGDEVFRASLSVPDNTTGVSVVAGQRRETSVTIEDDEEEVFVDFSPTNYTCREEDGICCLTVVASANVIKDYNVTVTTSDGSALSENTYNINFIFYNTIGLESYVKQKVCYIDQYRQFTIFKFVMFFIRSIIYVVLAITYSAILILGFSLK